MQSDLLAEGLTLMLAGMGTVFVFLTVLVLAMTLMSKLVYRPAPGGDDIDDETIAAISIAIDSFRRRR
ncbi:MAG: OadG family protein [Pseudomonadota bacterium]